MVRDLHVHAFDSRVALERLCHGSASFVTVDNPDPVLSRRSVTSPFITSISTSDERKTGKMFINQGNYNFIIKFTTLAF